MNLLPKVQSTFLASFLIFLMFSTGAFGTTIVLHGTGFDSSGNPLVSGAVDGNWGLSGGFTGSNQAFFIAPGNPNWFTGAGADGPYANNTNVATFSGSGWISNNATSSFNGPAPYTFSMQFDLSAFDVNTVSIAGLWAIADGGTLDINGNLVSDLSAFVSSNWESLHPFSIVNTSWLNPGINTINLTEIQTNQVFAAARFEASVTGTLIGNSVPEPATLGLFILGLGSIVIGKLRREGSL
jgi:hypothetical protein